jgi:AcrR family transcriptional regulator
MSKAQTEQAVEGKAKPNRMDRRRQETRAKLLKATLALVVKKGIEKTTMDDITEKADLGRRTLYYHFGSKEECVIASAVMSYTKIAEAADRSAHQYDDPALAFAIAGQLVMRQIIEAPITARLIEYPRFLATAIRQSITGYVDQDLALGIEKGRFELPAEGRLLDTTILWSLVGVIIDTLDSNIDIDESLIYFSQIHLIFLGLAKDEALAIAEDAVKLLK